jgi:integral membrane protein
VSLIPPRLAYAVWSVAEMFTWAGLITAMIARYGFGYDGSLFFVAGLAHGIIFLGYCAGAVIVGLNQRWSPGIGFLAITSAVIPFATVPFDRWLEKKSLLDGSWRLEATDDPRDHRVYDKVFRWFLRHPVILKLTVLIVLGGLLTALLLAGPPNEWGQS